MFSAALQACLLASAPRGWNNPPVMLLFYKNAGPLSFGRAEAGQDVKA
jgi:hypothetical protein